MFMYGVINYVSGTLLYNMVCF